MKKLVLITGVFVFGILNLQAQHDNDFIKNKTSFGIKGGLNYSYLVENKTAFFDSFNFHGGFFAETRLAKKWSFQNELIFTTSSIYNFIEVPLLLKYHINEKWSIFAGPSLDFALENNEVNSDAETLGLSMVVGSQYNFSKKFFLDARFNAGLTRQVDYSLNETYRSFVRNRFQLGVGYRF